MVQGASVDVSASQARGGDAAGTQTNAAGVVGAVGAAFSTHLRLLVGVEGNLVAAGNAQGEPSVGVGKVLVGSERFGSGSPQQDGNALAGGLLLLALVAPFGHDFSTRMPLIRVPGVGSACSVRRMHGIGSIGSSRRRGAASGRCWT